MLLQDYPEATQMKNNYDSTPLHIACNSSRPSFAKSLAKPYPRALGTVDRYGKTPLHRLCGPHNHDQSFIRYVAAQYPVAFLIQDKDGCLPLDLCPETQIAEEEKMLIMTKVANALIEAALLPNSSMSRTLIENVHNAVPPKKGRLVPWRNDSLPRAELDVLLKNAELQTLLKEEPYQVLVNGLVRMNRAGRSYVTTQPGNKKKGALVLLSVRDNPDCLFIHLCESPSLFEGGTPKKKRATNQRNAAAQNQTQSKKHKSENQYGTRNQIE